MLEIRLRIEEKVLDTNESFYVHKDVLLLQLAYALSMSEAGSR